MAYNEKLAERIRERISNLSNTNRPMKGYILIEELAMRPEKDFDYWIQLALDFNPMAKASKKKKKK
jgi:hypothetical protein